MITMDEVNSQLEASAQAWEHICEENGWETPKQCDWPQYFRGLKNFTSLDEFKLSSAALIGPKRNIIIQYLEEHGIKSDYEFIPHTGFCIVKKK